jgi:hypothetical protein
MIIHTYQKSKKRKLNAKQRELQASWEELVKKHAPKKPVKIVKVVSSPVVSKPFVRETPKYPSLDSWQGVATKPVQGKVYTGTLMKGIGTLHKSNAVPIFTDEEAKDQAAMRR